MLDPTKLALFVGVSWALILSPGPDLIYVITRGMANGRKAGTISAVGVICGILVHTTAAALGLTLIFQTSALAFLIVKYVGAAYLIYLGINAWRTKSDFEITAGNAPTSTSKLFWQGVLSNVLNPKVAMFFLAFLPQFVDKEYGPVAIQVMLLGLIFAGFGLCFLLVVGYSSGSIGRWITRRPSFTRFSQRLTGGILIGLGVRLAVTDRQ